MSFRSLLRPLGLTDFFQREAKRELQAISNLRRRLSALRDDELKAEAQKALARSNITEIFSLTAEIAWRVLGLQMFDEQLEGALAMQRGHIAEMQTGEGKTLAAAPAVIWFACAGRGVHVLTANDYLAHRDAMWMATIYQWFGLSVAAISQSSETDQRRAAYSADVTYATANEIGFDYLRDGLARHGGELVQRPFAFALIDEADSILIDEARIPLVIAGGHADGSQLARRADELVRRISLACHFRVDEFARSVQLTDAGIQQVEKAFLCGNLFEERNLTILTAVLDAAHAHTLLRRDLDYVVKNGSVELVDEFKGRIAENRRWPAGLQSAVEAKEQVGLKTQGRILGSITVQNLLAMYEQICGMTGTAATQAEEFWRIYKLPVSVIPTHRPTIRHDLPDLVYATQEARTRALTGQISEVHQTGRPILVGTASVEQSESLSTRLHQIGVPHAVLNARSDEAEAEIIAQAGTLGAVTISTNMAGRGTDIVLGGNQPQDRQRVLELGGLYVMGTTRHETARIDNQLRGRAGRQGDPGTSRFFVSLDDDLLVRFGIAGNPDIDSFQRTAEGQNWQIRQFLWRYESLPEQHRREMYNHRREVLLSPDWSISFYLSEQQYSELGKAVGESQLEEAGRQVVLSIIDDLWADYLASVSDLKGGIHWISWGGSDPLLKFLSGVQDIYSDFCSSMEHEIAEAFSTAEIQDGAIRFQNTEQLERGATWTYITSDQPFGTATERMMKGLRRKLLRVGKGGS